MALEKLIVGLTGNIASGKSSVSSRLKKLGAYVIDADKVVHNLYSKSFLLRYKLVREFGFGVLGRKLKIDRRHLGKIVFGNKERKDRLQEIVWPYVYREIDKRIEKKNGIIVVEAALLLDSDLKDYVDYTVVVVADNSKRMERLKEREFQLNGFRLTEEEVKKRFAAQTSQAVLAKKADYVVYNNSTEKELEKETKKLWSELLKVKSQ